MSLVIEREELKNEYPVLIEIIQKNHVMEQNIYDELFVNHKPVVNLCHTRKHFVICGDFFISYEMDHIITDVQLTLIGRRLARVTFYQSYQEYEVARVKGMQRSKDQTGLNFN
jgi:hypothetical protein